MRSRITIELDFDNNNEPYIQIHQLGSDDMRDNVLKAFLEKLGGDSQWLRITCYPPEPHTASSEVGPKWKITPIKPIDLEFRLIREGYKNLYPQPANDAIFNGKEVSVDPMTIRCGPPEPLADKTGSGSGW